jgi:small subunit ribosomal protein S16
LAVAFTGTTTSGAAPLVATKIKLMRLGKMREPHYRIVVADARTRRDGRAIETIGEYHPKHDPSIIRVDGERAAYWLGVGAQPTEAVTAILKVTGDWQKFTGQPAPEPMKVAPAKPDKRALFDAALADADGQASAEATTPRKRAATKAPAKAARDTSADAPTEAAPSAETTRTETTPTETTPTETTPNETTTTESAGTDPAPVEAPAAAADTPEGAEPTES